MTKPYFNDNMVNQKFNFSGKNILVVEDDETSLAIAENVLKKYNFNVILAKDGNQAVNTFNSKPDFFFETILMDVNMPNMDGIEATEHIRSLPKKDAKKIPIIAMTADDSEEDVEKSIASGMDEHISKPIEATRLLSILERYLDWKSFLS